MRSDPFAAAVILGTALLPRAYAQQSNQPSLEEFQRSPLKEHRCGFLL